MRLNLDRAVEPHENVIVGNFLYMLGLTLGSRSGGKPPPGCVNLLQQTPNDRLIGDILAAFHGTVRIIEFKRSTADMAKELTKLTLLQSALRINPHLLATSEKIHWYIETIKPTSLDIDTKVRPYLHLQNQDHPDGKDLMSFIDKFVEDILAAMRPNEGSVKLIQEYLRMLPKANGSKTTSAGGLIVTASKEKGIQYIATRDFRELALTLEVLQNDYMQDLVAVRELTKTQEIERSGPSISRW